MTANFSTLDLPTARLSTMLIDSGARTAELTRDLTGERLLGPRLAIVNPPLWEMGHLAWFQERWCLRLQRDGSLKPSIKADADALYDSAKVPHASRWDLPLPDMAATLAYKDAVLTRVVDTLAQREPAADLAYFAELVIAHEDMHGEAFWYTRQTLGYPKAAIGEVAKNGASLAGDVAIPAGVFLQGAKPGSGFVFDNEKWAHSVVVAAFSIARAPVTYAEFAAFVDDGGYRRPDLWSSDGWQWCLDNRIDRPAYWQHDGEWRVRRFDRYITLPLHQPVTHVNWFEADAWCRWAGRRLPSEAEWERSAAGDLDRRYPWGDSAPQPAQANLDGLYDGPAAVDQFAAGDSQAGCRQMLGNVWEWTADWFQPYPGFVRDPYAEYSEPWFSNHKVMRGGSFATRSRLMRNTWRNFYTPDRRDIFAGFRTCAR